MSDYVQRSPSVPEICLSLISRPGQLSLTIIPWVGAVSTSRWAAILCGWVVMAWMTRVWWQTKLWTLAGRTRVISERLVAKLLRLRALQLQIHVYFTLLSDVVAKRRTVDLHLYIKVYLLLFLLQQILYCISSVVVDKCLQSGDIRWGCTQCMVYDRHYASCSALYT